MMHMTRIKVLLWVVIVAVIQNDCSCHTNALFTCTVSTLTPYTSTTTASMSHHRHVPSNQRFSEVFPYRGGSTQQQQQARRKNTSIVASSVSDGEVMETHNTQITKSRNIQKWMNKNFFVLGMIGTVLFSYLFPTLGMTNGILRPELWLNQYGVSYVFLLSGLSIQLSQIKQATYNIKLNILVQSILFIIWPFCFGRPMQYLGHQLGSNHFLQISKPLWDGLLVLSCLPTTVNMCVILTSTVGGNVASALCNAVLSNLLGIVTTPILLFRFFGSDIKLPFFAMIMKLMNKVLLPVMIGQLLRARVPEVKNWYYRHEKILKRSQEVVLLGILWNAFCTAITSQLGVRFKDGIALLTFLPVVHLIALLGTFRFFSWSALKLSRSDVIAAMFCSSQKTLAFGLPIIQTIFEGNANVAIYSAPLMIIHPIQLMIGSILVPRLERYVKSQEQDNTAENGNRNNPDT